MIPTPPELRKTQRGDVTVLSANVQGVTAVKYLEEREVVEGSKNSTQNHFPIAAACNFQ
jgi:hypothetical protein